MRKFTIFLPGLLLLAGCNSNQSSDVIEAKPESSKTAITYAYTPREMPNWEIGKPEHAAFVLNALKKYETGKVDELHPFFSDSVSLADDGFEFNGTRDSLMAMFKKDRERTESISIEVHDWESVHGKDNKEDWVSIWYKSVWKGKDGKVDSAYYMDDVKIVDGKIRIIDTKKRRYPAKK
jgi:hypothetical protein